ncbi:MAG: PLP-dependent aminotransferase family protein [Peptococcales bacterium]|jgi:2-aminoadipate transaminase
MQNNLFALRARANVNTDLAELFKLAEQPEVISFAGGFPNPEWFIDDIEEITQYVIKHHKDVALQYSPVAGLSNVREYIAERMSSQNMECQAENILISSGSLQGLDLLCKIYLDPGDYVVVEAPTYLGAISTFESYEANVIAIPCDNEGIIINELEEVLINTKVKPKFIYVIPTFQNPSGKVWSVERRQELLNLCSKFQIPIIEDNAYGELRCDEKEVPTIKSLDKDNLVTFLGTFSKIFCPGIRLGWVAADQEIIDKLILFKQNSDQTSSALSQLLVLEAGRRGLIEKQIENNIKNLKINRDVTINSLEKYFHAKAKWTISEGGYYTWVQIDKKLNTYELLKKAVNDYKVAYVAGPSFYPNKAGGENCLRVCYSQPKPYQIEEGIKRLAKVFFA